MKPPVRIMQGWLSPVMISTTMMEDAEMLSAKFAKDAFPEVHSVGTRSVLRAGATTKLRSVRDELGASISTYDLEAVARRYRAKAVNRLARTEFRNPARSESRQRENVSDAVGCPNDAVLSRPIAWLGTSTGHSAGEDLVLPYWIRSLLGSRGAVIVSEGHQDFS